MTIPVKLWQQIGLCLFLFTLATGKIFAQQGPKFSTAGFYPVANSGRTVYNFLLHLSIFVYSVCFVCVSL